MKYHKIFGFLAFVSILSCSSKSFVISKRSGSEKPNILILHIDDLGYHDLSATGSKIYQTPNVDNLANESIRFTNAYANFPRCVPSRFAMFTGDYPVQDGSVPDDGFAISGLPGDRNYIQHLDSIGYQTAYFGKWHLGNNPKDIGFEYSFAAGRAGSPISYLYPYNTPKGHNNNVKKEPIRDLEEIAKKGEYLTDVLTDQVIQYITNHDKSKPFMTVLAFYAVHQPLEAKNADIVRNKKEINAFDFGQRPEYVNEGTGRTKMRQDNPVYAAMVENMDENVGKLLKMLKDQGLEKNTIVIFSSDHGGLSNDGYKKRDLATSNFPLRAGKGWLYEGGVKVPLFIKWPGHVKPREENESLVMLMDILPTLLDITSGEKLNTNGKSILPVINNKANWKNRTIYWHSPNARPNNTGDTESSAIRQGDYKLINWYKEGRTELYNIAKDPSESHDLSKEMPELTNILLSALNQWKSGLNVKS